MQEARHLHASPPTGVILFQQGRILMYISGIIVAMMDLWPKQRTTGLVSVSSQTMLQLLSLGVG